MEQKLNLVYIEIQMKHPAQENAKKPALEKLFSPLLELLSLAGVISKRKPSHCFLSGKFFFETRWWVYQV